jgi:nitroreductase
VKSRRLVSTRRKLTHVQADDYDAAWSALHAAATRHGAHAWRFASAAYPSLYLEFLEFAAGADPRSEPDVSRATNALDALAPGQSDEWDELGVPPKTDPGSR